MYQTWQTPEVTYSRLYADMLNQIHILIAGSTGSGKSTVVNGMMHAALKDSPVRVGFILIDPKGCELSEYAALPHVIDYANKPQDIPRALRGAVDLMNCRLADMKRRRQRTYDGSDVYVIIDELMPIMTRPDIKKACYSPLLDLLALGRAARVHVVACTQSPVAAVIPTPLKCNFDARLALRTVSAQDSRNIIGARGCECLPNPVIEHRAEGYYQRGPEITLYKLPRVEDAERRRVIEYWEKARPRRHLFKPAVRRRVFSCPHYSPLTALYSRRAPGHYRIYAAPLAIGLQPLAGAFIMPSDNTRAPANTAR